MTHEDTDIWLADLVRDAVSIREAPVIVGLTAVRCHVYGPAVLQPLGDTVGLGDCTWDAPDLGAMLWQLPDSAMTVGSIGIHHSQFIGCTFVAVALTGPPSMLAKARKQITHQP